MKTCKTGCGKMQAGGSVKKVKKMQKGGSAGIVGMPQYGNNPRTYSGRMLKDGGESNRYNRAVGPGCTGGMVKDENGKCVTQRKMEKGGAFALKPVNKIQNPGLAKLPTAVRNKMGYMKKGGVKKR